MMKRKSREGRLALAGLVVAVVVTSIGATPPLNPLVIRADQQRGAVPAECDDSLAPAPAPRVDVRQIPLPEPDNEPLPPPSASLRDAVRGVQEAIARNDRAGFDSEIARVRSLVRSYPTGAEKRSAEELLTIYTDIERMWNAQYESPFFARNSGEYAIASRYPGWEDAVRRSILTDARGERFYPAGETREFIARAAALRLSRLGISAPYPAPRTPRETAASRDSSGRETTTSSRTTTTSQSTARTSTERSATTARSATATGSPRAASPRPTSTSAARSGSKTSRRETTAARSSSTAARSATAKAATRVADASPRETPSRRSAAPSPASTPSASATSTPSASSSSSTAVATPPVSTPVPSQGDAQPLTGGEVPTPLETAPDAPGTGTAITTDTTFATDTALTTGNGTTSGVEPSAANDTAATRTATPAASRGRSVLLPLILILIGLGVLVVLFRMSN